MRYPAGTLAMALLLSGCAHTVVGTAEPVPSALKILPGEAQITAAAGNTLSTFGFKPFVGGVEILPDGYRTEADASPIACVAVTDTAPRVVYEAVPVTEAARQSYFNWDEGVVTSGADAAAVRLTASDAAQRVFDAFAQQWQQCDGGTVVKHLRGVGSGRGDSVIDSAVSDVNVDGPMLSATVRTQARQSAPASTYERALGVRAATIVEVSLAITPLGERRPATRDAAVRIARVMLDEVGRGG